MLQIREPVTQVKFIFQGPINSFSHSIFIRIVLCCHADVYMIFLKITIFFLPCKDRWSPNIILAGYLSLGHLPALEGFYYFHFECITVPVRPCLLYTSPSPRDRTRSR